MPIPAHAPPPQPPPEDVGEDPPPDPQEAPPEPAPLPQIQLPIPAPAIGISMGTHSIVACFMIGRHAIIVFDVDDLVIPSLVAFTPRRCLVGVKAYSQWERNPKNTIYDVKRLLGRFYDDDHIKKYYKEWPFEVIGVDNRPKYVVQYKGETTTFYPEEIMGLLFKKAKEGVEHNVSVAVDKVVISVPSQFNSTQRDATVHAATLAGFKDIQLINECLASAVCHSTCKAPEHHQEQDDEPPPNLPDKDILILSAGCGFTDVSIIRYGQKVFEVLDNVGTANTDITRSMLQDFHRTLKTKHKVNVYDDPISFVQLWKACEHARFKLGTNREVPIAIKGLLNEGSTFKDEINRAHLDVVLSQYRANVRSITRECLKTSKVRNMEHLDETLLVGGSAHLFNVQSWFDDSVATAQSQSIAAFPELYAAVGAASRAAANNGVGDFVDLVTMDRSSQSIAMATPEGKCRQLILEKDKIPCWIIKDYKSEWDNQSEFKIELYDGFAKCPAQNKLLSKYTVKGVKLMTRGQAIVRVTFKMDYSGRLEITAVDRSNWPDEVETQLTVEKDWPVSDEEFKELHKSFSEKFPPAPVPEAQPNAAIEVPELVHPPQNYQLPTLPVLQHPPQEQGPAGQQNDAHAGAGVLNVNDEGGVEAGVLNVNDEGGVEVAAYIEVADAEDVGHAIDPSQESRFADVIPAIFNALNCRYSNGHSSVGDVRHPPDPLPSYTKK